MTTINKLKNYVEKSSSTDVKGVKLYKVYSSFGMLEAIDLMISKYFEESHDEKGAVLLDVFGLLQGFFVGVDALYDLSISLTKNKYNVNINQNPILHELKFIRNDIVGHPTNRTYPDGSIGFSMLNEEKLTKDFLTYSTYYFKNQEMTVKERTVDFKKLTSEYKTERDLILAELENHCLEDEKEESYTSLIINLYKKLEKNMKVSSEDLDLVKDTYRHHYEHSLESKNRFYWRLKLIDILISWEESDTDLKEMVSYMLRTQILKLYRISLEIENKKAFIPYVKIPNILKQFFKFIRMTEGYTFEYLKNLNNIDYPFFESDINALYTYNPSKKVMKLLNWLGRFTDGDYVFLIGSALNSYNKKNI